jgi:hypothetical protein
MNNNNNNNKIMKKKIKGFLSLSLLIFAVTTISLMKICLLTTEIYMKNYYHIQNIERMKHLKIIILKYIGNFGYLPAQYIDSSINFENYLHTVPIIYRQSYQKKNFKLAIYSQINTIRAKSSAIKIPVEKPMDIDKMIIAEIYCDDCFHREAIYTQEYIEVMKKYEED